MKLSKKILLGILLTIIVLALSNCKILYYGLVQGVGQLKLVYGAVAIDELLNDSEYPDSLKQKLLLIKEIRRFAIDSLHLNDSKNYNAVYDLKGKPTSYVVQGSEKYRVKKYLWKFPVVGKLPYKGFFDEDDAKKEAKNLESQGYDVRIVNPSGWSTMGWFKDPVLSSMLRRNEAQLADLIIHELTHSTIFVKDNSDLNENIADYVGENGAKCYLASKYGDTSSVLKNFINSISDNERLAQYFLYGAKVLDSMYLSQEFLQFPDSIKDVKKRECICNIIENVDTVKFVVIRADRIKESRLKNINNTFFTGYMTYYNKKDSLRMECVNTFDGDFLRHFDYLKKKFGK